jgi:hypothetical protein
MAEFLVQRLHPALRLGFELRASPGKGREFGVLLRQGSLDNACGLYCVVMALILVGAVDRDAAVELLNAQRGALRRLARQATPAFVEGMDANELVESIEVTTSEVAIDRITGSHRAALVHTLQALRKGSIAIIDVKSRDAGFWHWIVVVGIEGIQRERRIEPRTLLALDPNSRGWPYCGYNARLHLTEPRPGARYLRYTSSATPRTLVTMSSSVALSSRVSKRPIATRYIQN